MALMWCNISYAEEIVLSCESKTWRNKIIYTDEYRKDISLNAGYFIFATPASSRLIFSSVSFAQRFASVLLLKLFANVG